MTRTWLQFSAVRRLHVDLMRLSALDCRTA